MSKRIEHQDFDRHYPAVLEFQNAVRWYARRALKMAEHDVERAAIRSALIRAGNLRTVAAKAYTDGPAPPCHIHTITQRRRNGKLYHRAKIRDADGADMWCSEVLCGPKNEGLLAAWQWLKDMRWVSQSSEPSNHKEYGISILSGTTSSRAEL